MRHHVLWILTLGAAFASCFMVNRSAQAVIVYEGFETAAPGGYTAGGSIIGVNPNGSTIGLDTNSLWLTSGGNVNGSQIVSGTGLTMGSGGTTLVTTGGSLVVSKDVTSDRRTAVTFDVDPYVGTLYQSFLVKIDDSNGGAIFITTGEATSTTGRRFRVVPRSNDTGNPVATDYSGSTNNNGSGTLVTGVTYIMLARYTRVGETINQSTPGVASVYALTSAQFDALKAGGLTDAELDGATIGSQITGRATFSDSSGTNTFPGTSTTPLALQIITGTNTTLVTYDEFRYGISFDDVTPIPEPNSIVLIGIALSTLALIRANRSRK